MVNHNGDQTASGGLLLFNGGTVCDDSFNDEAAVAICRKMGFDGSDAGWSVMENKVMWGIQKNYDIKLDDVICNGDSWADCQFDARPENCNHNEDVFLTCRGAGDVYSHFPYSF